MSAHILCVFGANLALLGKREPAIYGDISLDRIRRAVANGDEVTRGEAFAEPAGRIREQHRPCPCERSGANAEHDLIQWPAFVGVDPAGE